MGNIKSFAPFGYEGSIVTVEACLRHGIPSIDIVGIRDDMCGLMRDCVHQGILTNGMEFYPERVVLSFEPTDMRKDVGGLPLAGALAVLAQKDGFWLENDVLVYGALEPAGMIEAVEGTVAAYAAAAEEGIRYAIVPAGAETAVPAGIPCSNIAYVKDLKEAYEALKKFGVRYTDVEDITFENASQIYQSDEGQGGTLDDMHDAGLKFAMAVAVAGHHSLMVSGAPGCGKTMVLQRAPEIMPDLMSSECLAVTKIRSIAGLSRTGEGWQTRRPFRMPHQTCSVEGMCGGGVGCRPGEISLAHNGVLFLDEAAEFRTSVLQMLRVPLESNQITLSRAGRQTTFPAKFQLFMAVNPCPCGNYGSQDKICLCSARSVEQYWKKFSMPLLGRVAIRYDMYNPLIYTAYTVDELRKTIAKAWKRQLARQGKLNGELTPEEIAEHMSVAPDFESVLTLEADKHGWSPRTLQQLHRLSQTIADISESFVVTVEHLKVAIELHGNMIEKILGNS